MQGYKSNNIIGLSIKAARKLEGLSQVQLTKDIEVTDAAISYWENGINIPNVADCWKIADRLNISIDDIDRERINAANCQLIILLQIVRILIRLNLHLS